MTEAHSDLKRLVSSVGLYAVAGSGVGSSMAGLALAGLRAQERAMAFSALTMCQFITALVLNLVFVAGYGMGVRGIVWGNLVSSAVLLFLAILVASRGAALRF